MRTTFDAVWSPVFTTPVRKSIVPPSPGFGEFCWMPAFRSTKPALPPISRGPVGCESAAPRSVGVADRVEAADGDQRDSKPLVPQERRPRRDREHRPGRGGEEQVARLDRIAVLLWEADQRDHERCEGDEREQREHTEADIRGRAAATPQHADGSGDREGGEAAERERIAEEAEHALARRRHALEPRRRLPVDHAEPVAPELGVQLREELVREVGLERVDDERPQRERDVERGWLVIQHQRLPRREVRLQRVVPAVRRVRPPGYGEEQRHDRGAHEEPAGPAATEVEPGCAEAADHDDRRLPGQGRRAARRAEPPAQPVRPFSPRGLQEDEHGERAEQRERHLGMEEDAHPVDDRVGGGERGGGKRAARLVGPDLARDQSRDEKEPAAAGERDQLTNGPGLATGERDRLVESPERGKPERRDARASRTAPGGGQREGAARDEQQPEPARRGVPGQLDPDRRQVADDPLGCDRRDLEERRRRELVVDGLAGNAVVRVEVLGVGEMLGRVVAPDLPDSRDSLPAEGRKEAERDDDPGPRR